MPASRRPRSKAASRSAAERAKPLLGDRVHRDEVHVHEHPPAERDERRELGGAVVDAVDERVLERGAPAGLLGVVDERLAQLRQPECRGRPA